MPLDQSEESHLHSILISAKLSVMCQCKQSKQNQPSIYKHSQCGNELVMSDIEEKTQDPTIQQQ